ncbi:hypothetical protein BJP62_10905 [Jeongeupia sp. USM3]|nr:hypothetical protein BJP62_10905 [Jeongeupia sp. USM3]
MRAGGGRMSTASAIGRRAASRFLRPAAIATTMQAGAGDFSRRRDAENAAPGRTAPATTR